MNSTDELKVHFIDLMRYWHQTRRACEDFLVEEFSLVHPAQTRFLEDVLHANPVRGEWSIRPHGYGVELKKTDGSLLIDFEFDNLIPSPRQAHYFLRELSSTHPLKAQLPQTCINEDDWLRSTRVWHEDHLLMKSLRDEALVECPPQEWRKYSFSLRQHPMGNRASVELDWLGHTFQIYVETFETHFSSINKLRVEYAMMKPICFTGTTLLIESLEDYEISFQLEALVISGFLVMSGVHPTYKPAPQTLS